MTEVFWSFFITSIIGCALAGGRMLYKSKCKEMSLCCIHFVRDVEGEEKLDTMQLQRIQNNEDNNL